MILIVGREYRVKGYAYRLKLVSLHLDSVHCTLKAGAMTLHTTIDCIIGDA